MTIKELYNWAVKNNVEDCDISVRDYSGSYSSNVEPEIVNHQNNETNWIEIEL